MKSKKKKKYMVEVKDRRGDYYEWIEALLEPVSKEKALRIKDQYKKENLWHGYRIVSCNESSIKIVGRVGPFILGV